MIKRVTVCTLAPVRTEWTPSGSSAPHSHHHDRASASIDPAVGEVECLPELGAGAVTDHPDARRNRTRITETSVAAPYDTKRIIGSSLNASASTKHYGETR